MVTDNGQSTATATATDTTKPKKQKPLRPGLLRHLKPYLIDLDVYPRTEELRVKSLANLRWVPNPAIEGLITKQFQLHYTESCKWKTVKLEDIDFEQAKSNQIRLNGPILPRVLNDLLGYLAVGQLDLPQIVLWYNPESQEYEILDGRHRAALARALGAETITAYVVDGLPFHRDAFARKINDRNGSRHKATERELHDRFLLGKATTDEEVEYVKTVSGRPDDIARWVTIRETRANMAQNWNEAAAARVPEGIVFFLRGFPVLQAVKIGKITVKYNLKVNQVDGYVEPFIRQLPEFKFKEARKVKAAQDVVKELRDFAKTTPTRRMDSAHRVVTRVSKQVTTVVATFISRLLLHGKNATNAIEKHGDGKGLFKHTGKDNYKSVLKALVAVVMAHLELICKDHFANTKKGRGLARANALDQIAKACRVAVAEVVEEDEDEEEDE